MTDDKLGLSNGEAMPAVGLGTWKIPQEKTANLVEEALQQGYRHLDCACDYGNEQLVGEGLDRALQAGVCRRSDVWLTSKLWNTYHRPEHVRLACERSLRDLQVAHLDLYLIHFPIALKYVPFEMRYPPGWVFDPSEPHPHMHPVRVPLAETWGAMEKLVQAGLVRHIGICNVNIALLRDLLATATMKPEVLQVEMHPYLTQPRLLRFCQEAKIAVTAYSPLGAGSYVPLSMAQPQDSVLTHPVVMEAAHHHGKTPAQIVLRWGVQRGTAIIPKTEKPQRLAENLALFDFALTDAQIAAINALDRHRRFNDPGEFCVAAFNTFFPIYD